MRANAGGNFHIRLSVTLNISLGTVNPAGICSSHFSVRVGEVGITTVWRIGSLCAPNSALVSKSVGLTFPPAERVAESSPGSEPEGRRPREKASKKDLPEKRVATRFSGSKVQKRRGIPGGGRPPAIFSACSAGKIPRDRSNQEPPPL